MTRPHTPDRYGTLVDPSTLRLQRLLPGPVERVWSYLTDGDLRRQWLAAGTMDLTVDAPFELVWRNDELGDSRGARPDGFPEEHRMQSRILELEPPRRIVFTWGSVARSASNCMTRALAYCSPSPIIGSATARCCSMSAPAGTPTSISWSPACKAAR